MRSEIELILLGCLSHRTREEEARFDELLKAKQDWAFITGELIRHRVNGNFFTSMNKEQKGYIVHKVRQTLNMLCNVYEAANKVNLELSQTIIEKTNEAGIVIAGLKGMVFNTNLYPLGARRSNDIDVLVCEDDLSIFDKVMRELGFIQSLDGGRTEATKKEKLIQRMNYHDLVPYVKRIELPYLNCLKVDVNFHFESKDHDITRAILDEGVQVYKSNGFMIQGLKWTTHLMHLCVHFYREASDSIWTSKGRDVDLYKLVDLQNSLRLFKDEQLLIWCDAINKFELNKQCYFAIYYLNQFYPENIYKKIMEKIKPNDLNFLTVVTVSGGVVQHRKRSFFDQTFDMNYGRDFTERDFLRVF